MATRKKKRTAAKSAEAEAVAEEKQVHAELACGEHWRPDNDTYVHQCFGHDSEGEDSNCHCPCGETRPTPAAEPAAEEEPKAEA